MNINTLHVPTSNNPTAYSKVLHEIKPLTEVRSFVGFYLLRAGPRRAVYGPRRLSYDSEDFYLSNIGIYCKYRVMQSSGPVVFFTQLFLNFIRQDRVVRS